MLNSLILLTSASALLAAQGYGAGSAAPAAKPTAPAAGAPGTAGATAGRSLKDVPNITIKYYDVSGKDARAIGRSLAKQRPIDPVTKQPSVGGTNWTLGASITKRTDNGQCTVIAAKGEFAATAELPRLTTENVIPATTAADWRTYVGQLEQASAENLWFVYDRVRQVEQALVGQQCDAAAKAGSAAIEKLEREAAEFQRRNGTAKPLK